MSEQTQVQNNRRLLRRLALAAVVMFGFGYALVPIYNVLCEITGLNGKTASEAVALAAVEGEVDPDRLITVEFVTSVNESGPWRFEPEVRKLQVHPGEFHRIDYWAENLSGEATIGQAIPSVAPGTAARHFQKIECFCFAKQGFEAGETKTMPLAFRVDPKISPRVSTVTLSYTMFSVDDEG